jgi:hypothetical protein
LPESPEFGTRNDLNSGDSGNRPELAYGGMIATSRFKLLEFVVQARQGVL